MTKVIHGSVDPNIAGLFRPFSHFAFDDLPAKIMVANRLFVDEVVGAPTLYDGELSIDLLNDVEDLRHVDIKQRWTQAWTPSKPWIRIRDLHSPALHTLSWAWLYLNGGNASYDEANQKVMKIARMQDYEAREYKYREWLTQELTLAGIHGYLYENEREGKGTDAICVMDGARIQGIGKRSFSVQDMAETFINTAIAVNVLSLNEYEEATKKARMVLPS